MRRLVAVLVAGACFALPPPARAGTTGGLNGTVAERGTGAPIAGARVTATSPSQLAVALTDARGHFSFVSLAPDEYTISVSKPGFDSASYPGIAVFADAQQTLSLTLRKTLHTIASVSSRNASDLVRPGTTADITSIDGAQQARASALGGGGDLDSAYSAIASVPGAFVPANQSGYLQAVHVRGGDADQVGYELDGVPVNRAFDNYPSGSLSSLGQLELQVYTGATPAGAEAQGLAGFVNQVLKTGTFPGYATIAPAIGGPTFYHRFDVEAGGSTPDRLFSYYVGIGGFDQEHRYGDQFNGAAVADEFGSILNACPAPAQLPPPGSLAEMPPSCFTGGRLNTGIDGKPGYVLGPISFAGATPDGVDSRTTVVNLHVGIPHGRDSGHDDVQLLYDDDTIFTALLSSPNDEGLLNFNGTAYQPGRLPYYLDAYRYRGPLGAMLPANYASLVDPYFFPSSPGDRAFDAPIPLDQRDVGYNDQGIVKLQYQRNYGSAAYLRVYGYSYYSDYITTGPDSSWQPYTGYFSGDYELNSHTRGASATFADQLDSEHLLEIEGSYTTSTTLRMFNEQMFQSSGEFGDAFAVLVNPRAIGTGTCYALPTDAQGAYQAGGAAVATSCNDGVSIPISAGATFASLYQTGRSGTLVSTTGAVLPRSLAAYTCGGGPCSFFVDENGSYGQYNDVRPAFYGFSLTDQWHPSDRWNVNLGVRLDSYGYLGANTTGTAARAFWFDAFNEDTCFNKQTLMLVDRTALLGSRGWSTNATQPCSAFGSQYQNAYLQNTPSQEFVYNVLQPRIGATYTLGPDTVLRASYGKYNEQASSSYEQYDALQQNLPDQLTDFYSLGFNTPGHLVSPSISYNADFSLERHVRGTRLSFKITPFLRQTKGQVENFYTNVKAELISGLNVGQQTSQGFELGIDDGDFARNGFAGQLSFAYTNTYVEYGSLAYGATVLSPVNADIATYNAFTAYCAAHAAQARCGYGKAVDPNTEQTVVAAPCYTLGGAPVPVARDCTRSDVANPYWNAPAQPLLDPNARYVPYTIFPGAIGTADNGFDYPYVATAILNYKRDKLAVTPSLQFQAGNRYGAPETMPGVDPSRACGILPGSTSLDPRYPYGAAGGSPFDANCGPGQLDAIPDSYTRAFDGIGAFREPAQLLLHLRLTYALSDRASLTLTLANLLQTCFGGEHTPFTYAWNGQICSYTGLNPLVTPVGNLYDPGANVQTILRYPYEPSFGVYNDIGASLNQPFGAYLGLTLRL